MRFTSLASLSRRPTTPFALALAALGLFGCSNDAASDECELGSEGCHCYGNKTCDDDLACLSDRCVDLDSDGETEADAASRPTVAGSKDGSAEDVVDATAQDASANETPKPKLDAASESEPAGDTPQPDSEANALEPDASEATRPEAETATEPSPVHTGTSSVDETSAPGPGECVESGTCAAGNALLCVDGKPEARDCTGCAVMSCTCCGNVGTFGMLDTSPFTELPEIITEFVQAPDYVSIAVDFDTRPEAAMLVFNLDAEYTFAPQDVRVDLSYSGVVEYLRISFEDNSPDYGTGCMYDLVQDNGSVFQAGSFITCWGDYEGLEAAPLVHTVTVRIGTYGSSGSAVLTVRNLDFTP